MPTVGEKSPDNAALSEATGIGNTVGWWKRCSSRKSDWYEVRSEVMLSFCGPVPLLSLLRMNSFSFGRLERFACKLGTTVQHISLLVRAG